MGRIRQRATHSARTASALNSPNALLIAFLRDGTELDLIDAHGVILDRPQGEDLHFPIVTGLPDGMPREEREKRMQTYQEFLRDVDLVRSGSCRSRQRSRSFESPRICASS